MYFGREVMQRFFGLNVWVKTLRSCDDRYPYNFNDNLYYKIFTDLKYPSEATYIKEKQGVIVKVNRPGHKKSTMNFATPAKSTSGKYLFAYFVGNEPEEEK